MITGRVAPSLGEIETDADGDRPRPVEGARTARREGIVAAARELYEEQGLSKTTVQDITDRVGVTRSLFYHYFPDKEAVTSAVLDDYVANYIEALHYWNEQRQVGDIEYALGTVIKIMRLGLFENDAFRRSLASRENAALYLAFVNRVAERIAAYIVDTTVRDYGKLHEVRIDHTYETFYVLIFGIVGYVRHHPDVDDEVLKDLIAQTLHMDRGCSPAENQAPASKEASHGKVCGKPAD